jgi:hypothetical protein
MSNLTSTIDQLGVLNAEIAKLEAAADALKAVLVEVGPGEYQGDFYKVTVGKPTTRDNLDMKAVRAHLSTQFITAHTTQSPVKASVRVSVRKDVAVAA